jgi:hypothetical protein
MAYNPKLSIEGIQEVMARNNRRIAALQPDGEGEAAVQEAVIALHRHAVSITHVGKYEGGGALKSSHRMEVNGLEGLVYIDPNSVSPRRSSRRQKPVIYGVFENARGGEHAFYDRTVAEIGGTVSNKASRRIAEAVLYGK